MVKKQYTSLFLSHGGGPLPLLGDPAHAAMVKHLQTITTIIQPPQAMVIVSAHWEADVCQITSAANPSLVYDYHGFPPQAYQLTYPASGSPGLALHIQALLAQCHIAASLDAQRGFDHGMFVPLSILYPQADIPCIQLSLLASLDPTSHINIGKALASLRAQNILLIGSGFSFHNLPEFFSPPNNMASQANLAFEHWLHDVCTNHSYTAHQRAQMLVAWQSAPSARYCHPREEHLLPLLVCYGAASRPASQAFHCDIMGKQSSFFLW